MVYRHCIPGKSFRKGHAIAIKAGENLITRIENDKPIITKDD
jgi:hypothetical protein